jgi:TonB-dependent starch-binding outer membrane protein SusC
MVKMKKSMFYILLLCNILFIMPSVVAQTAAKKISGVVVDQNGGPLIGASVLIKGTNIGTITDVDGAFALTAPGKPTTIVVSFIGFATKEVVANDQKLRIILAEDSNELKEVVVQVGYGTVKKKDATGSVAIIGTKDFNKGAITNTENLLNGRVAGVVVTQGGRPGDGAAIRIRGGASLGASNDPLIVIDGLPVTNGLSTINPNDIESFSILKDASATAIYGSRGSNGVVLITTKKGTKQEGVKVSFNSMTTVNTIAKKANVYSGDQFRNIISTYVPTRTALLGDSNTDWQDEIFNNGVTSTNDFSVRGNLLNTIPTRLSAGYAKIEGVLATSNYDRKTVGLSMTPSFFDNHLKFSVNANYAYEKNRYADEGAIGAAISSDPTQAVYDSNSPFGGYNEHFTLNSPNNYTVYGAANPVALLQQKNNRGNNSRFYGNIQTEYKLHFLEDVKAVVNLGFDQSKTKGTSATSADSRAGLFNSAKLGYLENTWSNNSNKLLDAYLNYNKNFGNVKIDLTAGYSYQNFEYENYYSTNTLLPVDQQKADLVTSPGINLQAYYSRLNIDLNDKYLLTLNYRRDGSSRFSELNRWGNFPGAALAWKISNEEFLKDNTTVSELKLRLGWGVTGQQDIGGAAYDYFQRYNLSGLTSGATYQFGDQYYQLGRPEGYNANLKWEQTTTLNAGLDFGFFDDKLSGSIDVYDKTSKDLIAFVPEGSLQNFRTAGFQNIGSLTSKGAELNINYKAIQTEKSSLNFNYNIAYNTIKIKDLGGLNFPQGSVGLDLYTQIHQEGLAPNTFWLYEQVYDNNGKPLEGVYVDKNGDGQITSLDKHAFKKPNADITMGFMTNYNYKNWDFSMAWRTSLGNYIFDNVNASRSFLSQSISDNNVNAINNTTVDFSNTLFTQKRAESDYYVKNASWLKLDNVTIGYLINAPFNVQSSTLRLYSGVQNVLTISKYKGMDPEVFGGLDSTIYPRARMFMFGLNYNF